MEQGKSSVIRNDSIFTANWETKTNQTWLKAKTNENWQNGKNKSSNLWKQKKENEGYDPNNNRVVKDGVKKETLKQKEENQILEDLKESNEFIIQQNNKTDEINYTNKVIDSKGHTLKDSKTNKYVSKLESMPTDKNTLVAKETKVDANNEASLLDKGKLT